MKYFSAVLFLMLSAFPVHSQTAVSAEIDLKKIDFKSIEAAFLQKLNILRKEKNAAPIQQDEILKKAAEDQAAYMSLNHILTHDQKTANKAAPQLRVLFYKGTHDGAGENCIKIFLKTPMKVKYRKDQITVNTIEEAAEALFLGWKNSPGHYKNMIDPAYDVAGLGFTFNADSNLLYCAQVFAAKPFIAPPGFESPADAFGIKGPDTKVCSCMHTREAREAGNALIMVQRGDSIFIRSENLNALKKFFNKPGDAVYPDIVLRGQFVCANNNLLHGSPVYDGTMLKPVLMKDLFKANRAHGNNLFAPFCAVPEKMRKQLYNVNLGIVKEGVSCKYTWSVPIEGRNLHLLPLFPKWFKNPRLQMKPDTFKGHLNFMIPFERSKTSMDKNTASDINDKLKIYKPFIKSVQIQTFSSVEGSTENNLKLQNKRAVEIKNVVLAVTGMNAAVHVEAEENWDDFFKQISSGKFSFMQNLSKEEIKVMLRDKKMLDSIDYILRKTRAAELRIELEAVITEESDANLILAAYKRSIDKGDSLNAFACQNKLLEAVFSYQLRSSDITSIQIPFEKKFLPLWVNYIALAAFDPQMFYSYKTKEIALKAYKIDSLFPPMQFNFCIMALKYLAEFGDTLIPLDRLEQKMYSCYKMGEAGDTALVDHMILNYNILTAFNHYAKHEYDKVDVPLKNIRKYFEMQPVSEKEAVKLGLLFNFYGREEWTFEVLLPFMRNNCVEENLVFLFVQTAAAMSSNSLKDEEWTDYLRRSKKLNYQRFYKWIDKECFQLMRYPEIRTEFCSGPLL